MLDSIDFIAMEYYALILNRTYKLSIDGKILDGKVCRGITSIESGSGTARIITSKLAVHGDLNDPKSYVDDSLLDKSNRANFSIHLNEICSVEYTPKKKWGMGYYPHDGRIFIRTARDKREFIILGSQSGREIAALISNAVENSKNT